MSTIASDVQSPSALAGPPSWRPGVGLTTKLVLAVAAAGVFVLIGLAIYSIQVMRHTREDELHALQQHAEAYTLTLTQVDEAGRKAAEQSFAVLADRLPEALFSLAEGSDGKPRLQHAGFPLEGNTDAVDAFATLTGGVATVFQREGEDFRRITTSLKKEDGSRAVNTLLDRNHPAYPLMLQGQTYTGRAVLFGKTYMTLYKPIRIEGKVAGILFIGYDMGPQLQSLRQSFKPSGNERTVAWAVDVRPGPRQGSVLAAADIAPLPADHPLLKALVAAIQDPSAPKSGQLSGVAGVPGLAGEGPANVAWALYPPWGWVVVKAQRDADMLAVAHRDLALLWSLMMGGFAVAAVAVVVMLRRLVLHPLRSLTATVDQLSQNDYSRPLLAQTRDELGQFIHALEGMRRHLSANMRRMDQAAKDIDAVAREVSKGNMELGERTESASSNLQQSASSMAHLTEAVQHSANAAAQANQLAVRAAEVAEQGGQAVHQVVATMQDIQASSQKIADIIGVIDSIAFQTNILALNAAVEAARAGEAGRGFAVVASEVRNLAQRSAQAAKEIKDLIQASVDKVQSGTVQVQTAGQTMQEIVTSVKRVTDVIGEITAAAQEQSAGIRQVNAAVAQLDAMTQQNASLVEEVAAAADSLTHQTMRLREALDQYKTGNDGLSEADIPHRKLVTVSGASTSGARRTAAPGASLPTPKPHPDAHAPRLGSAFAASKKEASDATKESAGGQKNLKPTAAKAPAASAPAAAVRSGAGRTAAAASPAPAATPPSAESLSDDWETF